MKGLTVVGFVSLIISHYYKILFAFLVMILLTVRKDVKGSVFLEIQLFHHILFVLNVKKVIIKIMDFAKSVVIGDVKNVPMKKLETHIKKFLNAKNV